MHVCKEIKACRHEGELKYCDYCKRVYCEKCGKEWVEEIICAPSVTTAFPSNDTQWDYASDGVTLVLCSHG